MVLKKIALGVAFGLVAGVVSVVNLASAAPSSGAPQVQVQQGALRGVVDQGADAFLGIPYAQSPTGRLRFRAPQPPASWTGVRDATELPPACLQFQPTGVRPEQATSEDCLYLDVYRPVGAKPGDHLPVIFWMHGGAYTQGTGVIYGGQTMASLTHTIVVSINYRLGALGYLAVPEMGGNAGNWGTLDQIAALRWVHSNITAFGGDPAAVTIDGQSAGSGSVCSMLASPLTSGLFSRAILESGPCNALTGKPIADAYQQGKQYVAAAGCDTAGDVMACLRAAWAPNLVTAEQQVVINAPVVGGNVLPTQPAAAIANGKWHKVPILIGTVRWEGKLFERNGDLTASEYEQQIRASYGADADAVLAHYPASDFRKPFYALAAVLTDSFMACPAYSLASTFGQQVPTYQYEFNDPSSPTLYGFTIPGIDMSNAHSAELAYLWNFTLGARPLNAKETQLATRMKEYWATFARTGAPSAAWPRVTASDHRVLVLRPAADTLSSTFPTEHQCGFWGNLG